MTKALAGYLVVIDADGAEVPSSRRDVSGMTRDETLRIRGEMERVMGPGCYVDFKPAD
jgi:hypothetical protein